MTVTLGTPTSAVDVANGNQLTVTGIPATPVGDMLIVATVRATVTGNSNGVASVDADTNVEAVNDSHACRASSSDTGLHSVPITDALEAADSALITWTSANGNNRKAAVAVSVTGLVGTKHAASTFTLGDGGTSTGSNGSSASPSGGAVTVTGPCLIVWAVGFGGNGTTITEPTGVTKVGQAGTTVGTSDRNVALFVQEVAMAGTYSLPVATLSVSTGWSVAGAAYDVSLSLTPTTFRLVGGAWVPQSVTIL